MTNQAAPLPSAPLMSSNGDDWNMQSEYYNYLVWWIVSEPCQHE
jgi:hypothetical protein